MKKLDLSSKIGISISLVLILIVVISTLLKKEINTNEVQTIKGKLQFIQKIKPSRSWSLSYNLFLENDKNRYKIIPENYDCFDFEMFLNNVRKGNEITIGIDTNKGIRNVQSIVSLKSNEVEYINLECVNEKIKKDKTTLPLIILGLSGGILIFYFIQRKVKNK